MSPFRSCLEFTVANLSVQLPLDMVFLLTMAGFEVDGPMFKLLVIFYSRSSEQASKSSANPKTIQPRGVWL